MNSPKISVFKKVFWQSAGSEKSGKVVQIMGDHIVVKAEDGSNYMVRREALSTKSTKKS